MQATGIIPPTEQEPNAIPDGKKKEESRPEHPSTPGPSQNNSQNSSRGVSSVGIKPEPGNSENVGPNSSSELAKLRDQVSRLQNDNNHLKKKLLKAKDSKKAHTLIKKEKRRVLGSNNAIDVDDSEPIVIDLSSDD